MHPPTKRKPTLKIACWQAPRRPTRECSEQKPTSGGPSVSLVGRNAHESRAFARRSVSTESGSVIRLLIC